MTPAGQETAPYVAGVGLKEGRGIPRAPGGATGELPRRMAALPRDHAGRPVPWFVAWIGGKPDFRVVGPGKVAKAVRRSLCWVCGRRFTPGTDQAFVIGPMCAVNRVSAEPPCHGDCATWSATSCPFLANPQMTRRVRNLPASVCDPPGEMIRRNPGVGLVWVTGYRAWKARPGAGGGLLFAIGAPKRALWFARGRPATRAEVLASVTSGLPLLEEMAGADGPDAVAELGRMRLAAMALIPEEAVQGA